MKTNIIVETPFGKFKVDRDSEKASAGCAYCDAIDICKSNDESICNLVTDKIIRLVRINDESDKITWTIPC